ncbi:MAG: TraI/MobA(P) family conjugative relaxase [Acidithiobacillus sp.]
MIGKKIRNPRKSSSKAVRIGGLVRYFTSPEIRNAQEKCVYHHALGFFTTDIDSQIAEMVALASESVRSADPVNHYVLSWREGEQPSFEQVDAAVAIFLDELGLQDHQVIYAMHQDTDNLHLHIAVNRVHPETLKCVEIHQGFDKEAVQRAIARIEHAQGWQPERHSRYVVLEDGTVARKSEREPRKAPRQPARDYEQRTGERSAERIAMEDAAPVIRAATSWQGLHRALAEIGMRYEKKGSGALIFVGEVPVKASSADRSASLGALQKRLGPYEPSQARTKVAERVPEPVQEAQPKAGWKEYAKARKTHYEQKRAAVEALRRKHEQERTELARRQKERRAEELGGSWRGKGVALNAMRSVIAFEQAAEKAELRERQKQERAALNKRYPPYPDFEQWQRQQRHPELAEQWRYRESAEPEAGTVRGPVAEPVRPRDIRAFTAEIHADQVHYTKVERAGGGGGVSFVDRGQQIDIYDWRDPESLTAALQLSAQKWPLGFVVTGSDEYKDAVVRLAAEQGFRVTNPELQERIHQERQRLRQERSAAMKTQPVKQFEAYHAAVGADRYRVTSIKMRADGSKQTFILDKQDGVTRGFAPEALVQRTPEMLRLQRRGENLYYTPLSDTKHHILIDDMNREKLDRLIADGYRPAVVLESSPGNYQAILTVPKLGTPHDKDVGNRLSDALNREYGDPKLSGAIHPHRAPGFENRKPKHRRPDGSYPEVRLLKAERRECAKTLALSREIDAEYQRQAEQRAAEKAQKRPQERLEAHSPTQTLESASEAAVEAYRRHYADILKRQGQPGDLSRVDSMIAVRMRVTGHSQADIEAAVYRCAPTIRTQSEGRNWTDYAARTARYAYSVAGDRQAAALEKYRMQWEELEGLDVRRERQRQAAERKVPGHGPSGGLQL